MEWQLPDNWCQMTQLEHVDWHANRVAIEEPAYTYLEEQGIWNCFRSHEIQVWLKGFRRHRKCVEALIALSTSEEFQGLRRALKDTMTAAREALKNRSQILALQFRRSGFKVHRDEETQLAGLREQSTRMLGQAEEIETAIVGVCTKQGVDWKPFMQSHLLRR